jgi:ligand-binding sensor domain-containing protein
MFIHWIDDRKVLARTWVAGLHRSSDGGETWTEVGLEASRSHVMSITQAPDATLWVATFNGGVFRSADAGTTWQSTGEGLADRATLCVAAAADGTVWAGTYGDGVFRRDRDGKWQAVGDGLPPKAVVQALAIADDGRVWAGTYGAGLFARRADGGRWEPIDDETSPRKVTVVAPQSDRLLVGTQSDGAYEVDVTSRTWSASPLRVVVASLARTADGRIFAGLDSGVLAYSTDQGRTWTATKPVPWRDSALLLALGDALFAGTVAGLYVSRDGASTWEEVPLPDGPHDVAYLADAGQRTLLAGLAGEQQTFGLLQSNDAGVTWQWIAGTPRGGTPRLESSLSEADFTSERAPGQAGDHFQFCMTADSDGRVVVGTDRGLYHSVDRGRTWMFHFFSYGAFHAALDRNGVVYAAGMNGLFRKPAYGAELETMNVVNRDTLLSSYERVFALPDGRLLANVPGTDLLTPEKANVWTPQPVPELGLGRLRCVLSVDDETILVSGPNGLVAGRDGGRTWDSSPMVFRNRLQGP